MLTAFIVEAYKLLQPDTATLSVQVLIQISQQLTSLSVNPGFINSTFAPTLSTSFAPSTNSVVLNVLWFTALILSLVTVSLGMLVKQWLREILANPYVSPEQYCQVRLLRVRGLRSYKVTEIAMFLPLLLQLALALFFVGLILFIKPIDTTIASVCIALIAAWMVFFCVATFTPMVSPSCPYKTPFLKGVFFRSRRIINATYKWYKASAIIKSSNEPTEDLFVEETPKYNVSSDIKAQVLINAYNTLKDIQSWDLAMRCIDLNAPHESLKMLSSLVKRRYGSEITTSSSLYGLFDQAQLRLLLKSMTACIRKAYLIALDTENDFQLGKVEAEACVILRRLQWCFSPFNKSGVVLRSMAFRLSRDVLHVPYNLEFVSTYLLLQSGISHSQVPKSIGRLGEQYELAPVSSGDLTLPFCLQRSETSSFAQRKSLIATAEAILNFVTLPHHLQACSWRSVESISSAQDKQQKIAATYFLMTSLLSPPVWPIHSNLRHARRRFG